MAASLAYLALLTGLLQGTSPPQGQGAPVVGQVQSQPPAVPSASQTPSQTPGQGQKANPPFDPNDLTITPDHQKELDADVRLGRSYVAEVDKELKGTTDLRLQSRVDRVGHEMADIANAHHLKALWGDKRFSKFDYTFKVVKGAKDDVNAFSLPGGFIYVYEALVKYVESDDELAGILAHEISHAAFRHVATLQSKESKISAITLPLVLIGIFAGGANGAIDALTLGNLAQQAYGSGWSVEAEEAADYGGFQILTYSKYNPVGLLTIMERFAKDERDQPQIDWGIYRTHPPSLARAEALTKDLQDANIPIRRSLVSSSLRVEPKPGENGTVELWFNGIRLFGLAGSDALTRADAAAQSLNTFFDAMPEMFELKIGPDGNIYGRNRLIISINDADVAAAKETKEAVQQAVLKAIRGALYSYAFRVWQRY